nr:hypothetical protein [Armatimonas sp.]
MENKILIKIIDMIRCFNGRDLQFLTNEEKIMDLIDYLINGINKKWIRNIERKITVSEFRGELFLIFDWAKLESERLGDGKYETGDWDLMMINERWESVSFIKFIIDNNILNDFFNVVDDKVFVKVINDDVRIVIDAIQDKYKRPLRLNYGRKTPPSS